MSKHPRLAVSEFVFPIDTSKSISHALACLPSTKIWEHLQKHLPQGHILSGCNVIYKTPTALLYLFYHYAGHSQCYLIKLGQVGTGGDGITLKMLSDFCYEGRMTKRSSRQCKSGKFWVCGKAIQNMCIKDELKAYLVPVLPPIYICVPLIAENKYLANKVGCT